MALTMFQTITLAGTIGIYTLSIWFQQKIYIYIFRWIAHAVVGFTMWLFYYCSIVDPGIVTFYHDKKSSSKNNVDNIKFYKSFPFDDMLYQSSKICKTCKIEK
jgi:hypothetical protein